MARNWRETENVAAPVTVKKNEHGTSNYWTETEVTMLLEAMKRGTSNQHDLASGLQGIDTAKSRALRIALLAKRRLIYAYKKRLCISSYNSIFSFQYILHPQYFRSYKSELLLKSYKCNSKKNKAGFFIIGSPY